MLFTQARFSDQNGQILDLRSMFCHFDMTVPDLIKDVCLSVTAVREETVVAANLAAACDFGFYPDRKTLHFCQNISWSL